MHDHSALEEEVESGKQRGGEMEDGRVDIYDLLLSIASREQSKQWVVEKCWL